MKKMLMATTAAVFVATGAYAQDVKLGIIFGFTGPIESLTGPMASGAEMAITEVSESGLLLDGMTASGMRVDSGCIDNGLAVSNAERLIADGVAGIVGADCSGVTGAVLQNVAIPNGMVMISPSATPPASLRWKTTACSSAPPRPTRVKAKSWRRYCRSVAWNPSR